MSDEPERWIVVRNWDRFQHYKDRDPPWIKLYSELNSDPNWLGLTLAERGLLVTIWIEFGRSRGMVRAKSPIFAGTFARPSQFRSLSDAGFIAIVASKPLAIARSREAETEAETKQVKGKSKTSQLQSVTHYDGEWIGELSTSSERDR